MYSTLKLAHKSLSILSCVIIGQQKYIMTFPKKASVKTMQLRAGSLGFIHRNVGDKVLQNSDISGFYFHAISDVFMIKVLYKHFSIMFTS